MRMMSKEEMVKEIFGGNLKREEIGVIAGRIKSGLVEKLGVEVDCSWNDEEITILAFVNSSDYKEFIIDANSAFCEVFLIDAENTFGSGMLIESLIDKYNNDKTWKVKEAEGLFRDFKRFARECGCENISTWGHEVAWEGTELHSLDYYDSYEVYRANDCYAITLYDDLEDIKILVNFSDDEVRVFDLKTGLEIEDYYEIEY